MSGQEISISEFQLENCEKNISKLKENWAALPAVNYKVFSKRKGYSVLGADRCLENAITIPRDMLLLLTNTDAFLTNLRDSFANTDAKAAERINQLVE